MKIAPVMTVPALAHDAMMLKRFGSKVSAHGKVERRVIYNLCLHLYANGFRLHSLYDGEELTDFAPELPSDEAIAAAMNLAFNLDEASIRFIANNRLQDSEDWHGVLYVGGNGVDCIADWNYDKGDGDKFNATMEEFNADDYA